MFRNHHSRGERFGRHSFSGGGFGHDHHHGWRGERSGRRGERVFESGDLRFVLLALVAEKPSHGYELIKAVEDRLGGGYTPSPGVVYPTLTLLEELGYASVEAQEGGKKLYSATAAGRAFLEENKRTVDGLFTRMDEARGRGGRFSPQLMRAMENLKTALKYRMMEGPLTEAEMLGIAAAIDQAALAIEKKD